MCVVFVQLPGMIGGVRCGVYVYEAVAPSAVDVIEEVGGLSEL